jgi:hypothetical protein
MIHRILEGENATKAAIAAYDAGLCYKNISPMDLSPFFVNCVRVFSNPEVIEVPQQRQFDAQLTELSAAFGDIAVRPDVGAFLEVNGRPLVSIPLK